MVGSNVSWTVEKIENCLLVNVHSKSKLTRKIMIYHKSFSWSVYGIDSLIVVFSKSIIFLKEKNRTYINVFFCLLNFMFVHRCFFKVIVNMRVNIFFKQKYTKKKTHKKGVHVTIFYNKKCIWTEINWLQYKHFLKNSFNKVSR